jgi:hypothetical protein
MCIFHKWSKWEEYALVRYIYTTELFTKYENPIKDERYWQKRYCLKCNYVQRREVNEY